MMMDFGIATRTTHDFNDNLKKMAVLFLQTLPDFNMQKIIIECVQRLTGDNACIILQQEKQRVCPPTPRKKKSYSN